MLPPFQSNNYYASMQQEQAYNTHPLAYNIEHEGELGVQVTEDVAEAGAENTLIRPRASTKKQECIL